MADGLGARRRRLTSGALPARLIHHEVGPGHEVGAANVKACTSGIGILNGARGGANVPASHRKGIHGHLARHLRDAGEEPAALK